MSTTRHIGFSRITHNFSAKHNPPHSEVHLFSDKSKIHETAKLYEGIKFRPYMTLIMKRKTHIGDNCTILVPQLTMKKGSQICAGTVIAGKEEVVLGENVVVGYNCTLLTASDTPDGKFMNDANPEKYRTIRKGPITFKKNSFLGSGSIVMPNVVVAKGIVIQAQSYVDHSLTQEYFTYNGNTPLLPRRNKNGKIRRT